MSGENLNLWQKLNSLRKRMSLEKMAEADNQNN